MKFDFHYAGLETPHSSNFEDIYKLITFANNLNNSSHIRTMPTALTLNKFINDFFSALPEFNSPKQLETAFPKPKELRNCRYVIRQIYNLTPSRFCDALKGFAMWYRIANASMPLKAVALQVNLEYRQYGDFCAFTMRTFSMMPADVIQNPDQAKRFF